MIRPLSVFFLGLWVGTAVVAEENSIFRRRNLTIVDGPSEDIPTIEHVALKNSFGDARMAEPHSEGAIHANRTDHLYYLPSCEGYQDVNSADLVPFVSEEIATESGYQRAQSCS
ncbi:MAG: hypothetical protein EXR78_03050 [Deltaproteobacteria bacterium]|nr:hypothetical protein [Deltaproteobacteria bacterium]